MISRKEYSDDHGFLVFTVNAAEGVGYFTDRGVGFDGGENCGEQIFGGVGAALYTFTLLATVVVEGGLPKRLQRRRHERMLETIKDHFIICGYGRIGSIVARQFNRQRVPYVVIERDPERVQTAMDEGALGAVALQGGAGSFGGFYVRQRGAGMGGGLDATADQIGAGLFFDSPRWHDR